MAARQEFLVQVDQFLAMADKDSSNQVACLHQAVVMDHLPALVTRLLFGERSA